MILFINYLSDQCLPIIINSSFNHEKTSRTKTDYPVYRSADCFQHSCFPAFQQRERGFRFSKNSGVCFFCLDDFYYDFFLHCKKI